MCFITITHHQQEEKNISFFSNRSNNPQQWYLGSSCWHRKNPHTFTFYTTHTTHPPHHGRNNYFSLFLMIKSKSPVLTHHLTGAGRHMSTYTNSSFNTPHHPHTDTCDQIRILYHIWSGITTRYLPLS